MQKHFKHISWRWKADALHAGLGMGNGHIELERNYHNCIFTADGGLKTAEGMRAWAGASTSARQGPDFYRTGFDTHKLLAGKMGE